MAMRNTTGKKVWKVTIRPDENRPEYVTEQVVINLIPVQIPVGEKVEVCDEVYKALIKGKVQLDAERI